MSFLESCKPAIAPDLNKAAMPVLVTAALPFSPCRPPKKEPSMKIVRIEQDDKTGSRFSDHHWKLEEGSFTPPSPSGYATTTQMGAESVLMMHHPAGYVDDWHTAPAIVLGTVMRGIVRIQTSDMDTRVLKTGDQFLACDLKGKGHRMSEVNDEAYNLALVVLQKAPGATAFTQ